MELKVLNKKGNKTTRSVELVDAIYGVEPNEHAVYLDVRQYLANQRQGTHKAKERAEITGSTKKIKKQKGTGTARAGSIKSPLFRGGGRVFGPRPRNYGFKLNKKTKKLARLSALSAKAQANAIHVLEDISLEKPRTKEVVELVGNLKVDGRILFVIGDETKNANFYLSARNIPKVKVVNADSLNTYDVVNASGIVLSESSVSIIENNLLN